MSRKVSFINTNLSSYMKLLAESLLQDASTRNKEALASVSVDKAAFLPWNQ